MAAVGLTILYAPARRRAPALLTALVATLLVATAITWDALRPAEQQTHIGRLVSGLLGGSGNLVSTVAAKLAVNWRVSRSFWGLLIVIEGALSWWIATRASARKTPETRRAATLFTVAALAAWIFNDSGAVAAALLLAPCPGVVLLLPATNDE